MYIGGQPCTCLPSLILNPGCWWCVSSCFLFSTILFLLWCDWVCLYAMQFKAEQCWANCKLLYGGDFLYMELCSKLSGWTILSLHNVGNGHWLKGGTIILEEMVCWIIMCWRLRMRLQTEHQWWKVACISNNKIVSICLYSTIWIEQY